jgi:hypothetical protein
VLLKEQVTGEKQNDLSIVSQFLTPVLIRGGAATLGSENRLHWRGDVTLREDHCQVRKGDAPRVLAVLNRFLLALLDLLGIGNVPKQMRLCDAHPLQAVRLLLGSLRTFK